MLNNNNAILNTNNISSKKSKDINNIDLNPITNVADFIIKPHYNFNQIFIKSIFPDKMKIAVV